jgi:ABC-type transporter Mla subunit MlaD
VVDALDGQRGDVGRLARDAGAILSAVGSRAASLRTLATAGNEVLSATASRDRQLTATVDALPAFLSQLRATLGALDTTLRVAKPSVLALQPAGPLLTPALSDVVTLSGPAIRLLHQAPGLLDAGTAALPALQRFASALRPAADAILPAARDLVPTIDYLASYGRELTTTFANAAAFTQATAPAATTAPVGNVPAGTAHYARVLPPLNDQMFFGQSVREPTNRHNPYIAPGGLGALATGLASSDCANLGDLAQVPLPGGLTNVPCVAASGWRFEGLTQYFPHLVRAPERPTSS